jgi:putative MATE family efflux protein
MFSNQAHTKKAGRGYLFSNQALGKLIIPLFMDQILLIAVAIIATMMLSHTGEAAVSGVSLVDMINMLIVNVLAALTVGGAVVVSQYIGRKEKNQACNAASQLFTISTIVSLGIMLLVVIFHKPMLRVLFGNIQADVMAAAVTYFVISALSYPFLAIYDSGAALFRSMGKSRIPMSVSIIMNLINLVGNAIAIFVLHAGVAGVGFAALIARIAAAVIMIYLSHNRKNEVFIHFSEIFTWNGKMIKRIQTIAIPNGIESGLLQLGRVLLISIIALFGTPQIAANGITNGLVMIAISFATAMNLAIIPVVGQCIGAGDYSQAVYYMKKLTKINYIGTLILSLAEILFLPWILNLYTLSTSVHQLTFILVVIHNCFAIFLWPVAFTLSNGLRAAGDVRFTMSVSIISMFVFRLIFAYILGVVFHMGVIGIWTAMGIDWTFRFIVYIARFKGDKWKSFQVI